MTSNKEEIISVRVTNETKQRYEQLKKEFNKTGPELITFLLWNTRVDGNNITILNTLEEKYTTIENIQEIVKKLETHLVEEKEKVITQKKKVISKDLLLSNEERMKKTIKDYMERLDRHTSSFGILKYNFDVENTKHKVCQINNVPYDDFNEALGYLDKGLDLESAIELVNSHY